MPALVRPATRRTGNNNAKGQGSENRVRTAARTRRRPGARGSMRHPESVSGLPSRNLRAGIGLRTSACDNAAISVMSSARTWCLARDCRGRRGKSMPGRASGLLRGASVAGRPRMLRARRSSTVRTPIGSRDESGVVPDEIPKCPARRTPATMNDGVSGRQKRESPVPSGNPAVTR